MAQRLRHSWWCGNSPVSIRLDADRRAPTNRPLDQLGDSVTAFPSLVKHQSDGRCSWDLSLPEQQTLELVGINDESSVNNARRREVDGEVTFGKVPVDVGAQRRLLHRCHAATWARPPVHQDGELLFTGRRAAPGFCGEGRLLGGPSRPGCGRLRGGVLGRRGVVRRPVPSRQPCRGWAVARPASRAAAVAAVRRGFAGRRGAPRL